MSIRKMLPLMMAVFALLAASAAFASDAPPVPMSKEEFLSMLQASAGEDETVLLKLEGEIPAPQSKHGTPCDYLGVKCRACTSGGYTACDVYRCSYNGGTPHNHYYCSGFCSNPCAI